MAKNVKGLDIHIVADQDGVFLGAEATLLVGSSDDPSMKKVRHKRLNLTAQQITAIQNFIDNKFSELKGDEGIS